MLNLSEFYLAFCFFLGNANLRSSRIDYYLFSLKAELIELLGKRRKPCKAHIEIVFPILLGVELMRLR